MEFQMFSFAIGVGSACAVILIYTGIAKTIEERQNEEDTWRQE